MSLHSSPDDRKTLSKKKRIMKKVKLGEGAGMLMGESLLLYPIYREDKEVSLIQG